MLVLLLDTEFICLIGSWWEQLCGGTWFAKEAQDGLPNDVILLRGSSALHSS